MRRLNLAPSGFVIRLHKSSAAVPLPIHRPRGARPAGVVRLAVPMMLGMIGIVTPGTLGRAPSVERPHSTGRHAPWPQPARALAAIPRQPGSGQTPPGPDQPQPEPPGLEIVGRIGGGAGGWGADRVVMDGGHAFVTDFIEGLPSPGWLATWRAIDVRDPARPQAVGGENAGWVAAVENGIAYVETADSEGARRLGIVDVRRPAAPMELAAIEVGGDSGLRWYDDLLYAFGFDGLHIVDVSDPRRPRVLADLPGCYRDIAVRHGILYGWQCETGMIKLDVSDLRNIRTLGSIDWHFGEAVDMAVDDARLYVAHEYDGTLSIRDLGDLCATPQLGVATAGGGRTRAMALAWPNAYMAGSDERLRVIDVGDPAAPRDRGGLDLPAPPLDLGAAADVIVVAAGPAGLIVLGDHAAATAPPSHTIFLPVAHLGSAAEPGPPPALIHAWQPAASPDGRWLVYVADDLTADRSALRLRRLSDGADAMLPTPELAAAETPTFTPDGQAVIFAARLLGPPGAPGDWEVYRIARDGSALTNLSRGPTTDERRPALSPDGRSVAFDSDRGGDDDLYVLDIGTRAITRLTDDPAPDRLAAFSPDGGTILFRSERDGFSHIYRVARDGGAIRQLTRGPSYDTYASFSPDGRSVVFQSQRECAPLDRAYVMDADGGRVRAIGDLATRYATPRFGPDGHTLVLSTYRDGRWRVAVLGSVN